MGSVKLTSMSIVLLVALLSVLGCSTPQRFEDASFVATYHTYLGATYRLLVPMHISGVNAPPGYEKTVDYYTINPTSPSWSGPELISRDTLPAGTEVTVQSVRRCMNCPFDEMVEAEILIPSYTTEFIRPIHIRLKYLAPEFATKQKEPIQSSQATPGSFAAERG